MVVLVFRQVLAGPVLNTVGGGWYELFRGNVGACEGKVPELLFASPG